MKRFTDDLNSQPAVVKTGRRRFHLIDPNDAVDDIPPAEDDPCWNVTSLEDRAQQSVEDSDS